MAEKPPVTRIHVHLLDEGIDVWRPVEATHIRECIYRISPESAIPDSETWEFLPGDVVRCEERRLSRGNCLVAIEKMESS